jgi:hypothetical protein
VCVRTHFFHACYVYRPLEVTNNSDTWQQSVYEITL